MAVNPIYAIIPFRGHTDLTLALVKQLLDQHECSEILLLNNGEMEDTIIFNDPSPVFTHWVPEMTLHEMWNWGWKMFKGNECDIAFLNNDIIIPERFLSTLQSHYRSIPDAAVVSPNPSLDQYPVNPRNHPGHSFEVHGVGKPRRELPNGGMAGWAFMVKGEIRLPYIADPKLSYWRGDDDLVATVNHANLRVIVAKEVGVQHLLSQTLGPRLPELQPIIDADEKYYLEKWKK